MTDAGSFASLTPTLLARKGGAKPAMRPQLQPLFNDSLARTVEDDLGWNDMGDDADPVSADVVSIVPTMAPVPKKAPRPVVVQQREAIEAKVTPVRKAAIEPKAVASERRSAQSQGRRAAFTLRVDDERHLKLRLACTIRNRSAQQLVTEALDRLLAELPELGQLADQVARKR
jgi:hypothetical protein